MVPTAGMSGAQPKLVMVGPKKLGATHFHAQTKLPNKYRKIKELQDKIGV